MNPRHMDIHESAISVKGTVSELGALWIDESKRRECSKSHIISAFCLKHTYRHSDATNI